MVEYSSSPKSKALGDKHNIVLPVYTLDSNLVLLPGIIYNVTFSRFKAAALLSRFKEKTNNIPIIKNLLNEYDFNEENLDPKSGAVNPQPISKEAINGIKEYHKYDQVFSKSSLSSLMTQKELKNFDWFVLAITPNLDKVRPPLNSQLSPDSNNVVTIVKITGISDDSTNIRLSLKATTRGLIKDSENLERPNEKLIDINWNPQVSNLPKHFERFSGKVLKLLKGIDDFIIDYRNALAATSDLDTKKSLDLLALNPLANALYLQLFGSKDFSKAYTSLQKLIKASISDESMKRDDVAFMRLIDFTSAIIPFPNHEKLTLLSIIDPVSRVDEINTMMEKLYQVLLNLKTNNLFISHWFVNEATNVQKANLVASQLKSIRLVLEDLASNKNTKNGGNSNLIRRINNGSNGNSPKVPEQTKKNRNADDLDDESDDDDLSAIAYFIQSVLPHVSSLSKESKRLILKDYKRIKSSPPGNSDYHVIRNYLDIVADIPWDKYVTIFKSNQEIDVNIAKRQLDEDHYGLENVKKRLIQYLVVLKLLGLNTEANNKNVSDDYNKMSNKDNSNNDSIVIADDSHDSSKGKANDADVAKRTEIQKTVSTAKKNKSPIIMLSGPPGIGKTSLAKSIAKSLGRNFQRISLGGIKDESEIRGHRRTYVGAMPGLLVQALRKARSMNPVILLDEIDKVVGGNSTGNKFNGDPSAALLEVLDPEQNNTFIDHYLGFPIDLSQVIFICTANEPYNLSKPLLDRLEMIELDAYDVDEKLIIGQKYLLPRQILRNGFPKADLIQIDTPVMKKIIIDYTREAGVRNLERRLGTICRHKAVEYAKSLDNKQSCNLYNPKIDEFDLSKYLGVPYPSLSSDIIEAPTRLSKYGVVNGLSYNSDGSGSVLIFESIGFNNSTEKLNMTGRLGEVLLESAKIGLTFVKLIIFNDLLNLGDNSEGLISKFKNLEINLHVPAGSIPKDGPSAGITMALLFLSLILEKPVPNDIAMTGEITLRGMVLPIGGLKEKLYGAHLAGIKRVIVPRANRKDLIEQYVKATNDNSCLHELLKDNELKYNYKNRNPENFVLKKLGIQVFYASEFWDVIKIVWGDNLLMKLDQSKAIEYHL